MASRDPRAIVTLEVESSPRPAPIEVGPETPFCVALLGDFSGRELRDAPAVGTPLAARRPLAVDRDDVDAVLRAIAPEIVVPLDEGSAPRFRLRFAEMDDFTPERLVARMAVFPALRAAAEGRIGAAGSPGRQSGGRGATEPGPATGSQPPGTNGSRALAADLASGSLLDRMLDEAGEPEPQAPHAEPAETMEGFLRRITAPHLVPEETPDAAAARRHGDALVADQLRRILHHRRFQALEALWRTVFFLTRRLETGQELRLSLLDVSRAELAADLATGAEATSSALHRVLSEHAPAGGAAPWAALVGLYAFGPEQQDLAVLSGAADLGRALGTPFLAAARPELVGAAGFARGAEPESWKPDPAPAWAAFRRRPEARFIGLALPRFMLRLPYGRDGELTEVPGFEEMPEGEPRHEDYLWGNAAALCAMLLAQTFSLTGWDLRPGSIAEVPALPLHLYRSGTETVAKPCAETWLSEHAADRIMERGIMALASMKNHDSARLVRFQSVADPLAALAGPWA